MNRRVKRWQAIHKLNIWANKMRASGSEYWANRAEASAAKLLAKL